MDIEQLKKEQSFDKIIIYLLYFGLSKSEIERRTGMSRQHIYDVIERTKDLLVKYGLLDTSDIV